MSLKTTLNNRLFITTIALLIGLAVGVSYDKQFGELSRIPHSTQDSSTQDSSNQHSAAMHNPSQNQSAATNEQSSASNEQTTNEPLYWVAPMDDNYRRDKPGKSPMGMDLVPVYAQAKRNAEEGVVKINPSVVNNLGVRTAKVSYARLDNQINTVGVITYNEDKLSHIHPRIAGWIEKLYIKATGDLVEKGQPLYELYSPELVNAQEEYLLTLAANDKRLIAASENRLKALHIPQEVLNEIKSTKQVKQHVMFTAPQSGFVKDLNIREGFYVELGTKLFSIGDLSQVWVEAEVFERQYRKIHQGDKVSMNLDYLPEHVWQGEVDYIYPILDAETRTVRVRLRFQNPDLSLKPNMFAQVTIHDSNDQQQLLIPKEALIRTGKQDRVVLALNEGEFKSITVKIGNQDAEHIEVLSGLNEGDKIVVSAQFLIDSESSKTSDFLRMSAIDSVSEPANEKKVWTQARIEKVMLNHRMVTMTHQAIDEWDWPEMTMDFIVSENVDISQLENGLSLHVEISQRENGENILSNIHIMAGMGDMESMDEMEDMNDSDDTSSSARVNGVVNSIDKAAKQVNISRGPIEKWGREAATMDFVVSPLLSIDAFKKEQSIDFTFAIIDGEFIITTLHNREGK
ncbi:efflux RND transporter periplasmic adaptor subunit [Colwellia sp. 1_MG-2023]|uniref:efflux RND transporter periplasmic adaptor subunit n=1 Tax=Colwellia sp. 1_MG-2023 TaxID=3062649 RepID=UPI0026E3B79E|nr:efflux RND transporter periplasmic adaptor subunit [Colwellia sp. 1_MG-2023]MDO6446274.1 efflux RND transporter periplasmic adaptor subunit [Colwellia sp. 1_MG-2023]